MGNSLIHFNTCAISTIISARFSQVQKVKELFDETIDPVTSHGNVAADGGGEGEREESTNSVIKRTGKLVSSAMAEKLMKQAGINKHDRDILQQIFQLLDVRGFDDVALRDFLACFSLILEDSLEDRLKNAISIYYDESEYCDKKEVVWLLKLLNNTCYYFGDRRLLDSQVVDLVDSMFTLAGKIDGSISREETFELLISHPILEMFISMQYQGTDRTVVED